MIQIPTHATNSFFTLPQSFYLGNYQEVLKNPTLGYAYRNTIYITLLSLLLELLVMPPMSFALSRGMYHNSKIFKGLYFFFLHSGFDCSHSFQSSDRPAIRA